MRLLIKIPSRERQEQLLSVTKDWLKRLSGKHECVFLFTLDADDVSAVETSEKLKLLFTRQNDLRHEPLAIRAMCETRIGPVGRTKVQACNADIEWMRGQMMKLWGVGPDVLVLASDDMLPAAEGIDD